MSETVITVRGSKSATAQPELAKVTIAAKQDGAKRPEVMKRTLALAATVRSALERLHHESGGPVTQWSSQSIQVWDERPWNEQGKQLPPVHHARQTFRASFNDFQVLAEALESLTAQEGITVESTVWELRETSRHELLAGLQREAVADAAQRARVYAEALGLSQLRPLSIADPGMLEEQTMPAVGGSPRAMFAMRAEAADAASGLELRPEELRFSVEVDARFAAS